MILPVTVGASVSVRFFLTTDGDPGTRRAPRCSSVYDRYGTRSNQVRGLPTDINWYRVARPQRGTDPRSPGSGDWVVLN